MASIPDAVAVLPIATLSVPLAVAVVAVVPTAMLRVPDAVPFPTAVWANAGADKPRAAIVARPPITLAGLADASSTERAAPPKPSDPTPSLSRFNPSTRCALRSTAISRRRSVQLQLRLPAIQFSAKPVRRPS